MKLSMLPLAPFIIQLLYQLLIWSKVKFILLNFFMGQLVLKVISHQFVGLAHIPELLLSNAEGLLGLVDDALSDVGVPGAHYLLLDAG